ncbi:hypothetical protein H4R99_006427 [Coemansia sp. RSA 1722]|nr:hypothetical protein H4R99_006427 [Coemansia sp. RSA 1722]KAJ2636078.1 hypothetical protein GGF40_003225 [Coemansia sp. RSA 1286]KAJ2706961.1 hypothetical protein FB645_001102 [Coemansia sp. IMI 203386]
MSLRSSSSSSADIDALPLGKLSNITHQGWLYRYSTSSFLKSWKRRFFVISDERLYMFKDNYHGCRHGAVIDLTSFRSVQQVTQPRKTKHGFILRTLRRPSVFEEPTDQPQEMFELELYAESEDSLNEWIGAISKVFVTMDLRSFQSPLSNFDALLQRTANMQPRTGGSILNRMEKSRANAIGHAESSSTLVSPSSTERLTLTPFNNEFSM